MNLMFLLVLALTPQEQYEALVKQYDAPLKVYIQAPERARLACQPFLQLARDHPDDPAAVDALHWVVTHTCGVDDSRAAMDLLARDHSRDGRLGMICRELNTLYGMAFKPLENLLRAVLANSPEREIRGIACLELARRLEREREFFECQRLHHEAEAKGVRLDLVPKPKQTEAELAAMGRESQELYQRVIDEFGEIPHDRDVPGIAAMTLGAAARIERVLASGRVAPEIEGEDVDGKHFKLSDYRGKVVVLNFWSHVGCGICRGSYPELRALVKRMEGKSFVLLGINDGDKPDTLRQLRESGEVTWRFWVDGEDPAEGKILNNWNYYGWPMYVILDRKGVIRYQSRALRQLPLIEYAAETLMAEEDAVEQPQRPRRY